MHQLSETHAQRVYLCDNPAEDILEEDKLEAILHRWKYDYKQWMRPETLQHSWTLSQQKWQQFLRTRFRSHLFQIVGCYELVVFFIVAPFSNDNLLVFRHYASETQSGQVLDKKRLATILEKSKAYLRWTNER